MSEKLEKQNHQNVHIGLTDGQAAHAGDIDPEILQAGYALLEEEKHMSLRQCLRTHWRAAFWSAFLSTALWMEGFVNVLSMWLPLTVVDSTRYSKSDIVDPECHADRYR